MKYLQVTFLLLLGIAIALHGCDSDPFPVGESFEAGFQVPFVDTYTFHFRTGTDEITGVPGNLQIISGADVQNLLTATPGISEQSNEKGVISGRVLNGATGFPVQGVSIGGTDVSGTIIQEISGPISAGIKDADGNIVAPLLYNSINGTPQFINTFGTSDSGGFTALNVPPGQHFITAVQGGRGSDWLTVFAEGLSLIDVDVIPVKLPSVRVTGIVRERGTNDPVVQAEITILGLGGTLTSGSGGSYTGAGFGSDSRFPVKVRAAAQVDTYQEILTDLSLLQPGVITPDITQNLTSVSSQDLSSLALSTGVTMIPGRGTVIGKVTELGGRKSGAVVAATDINGNSLGAVFYFPEGASLPTCCLAGTDSSGQFLIFNIIPGDAYLSVRAETATGDGPIKSVGRAVAPVFSDAVSLAEIVISQVDRSDTDNKITVAMSGTVRNEDGGEEAGAEINIFNPNVPPVATSDPVGEYLIATGGALTSVTPLLANSAAILRVEISGTHLPTYQDVVTGSQDLIRDLTVVTQALTGGPIGGSGAVLGRVVNRQPGGRVDKIKIRAMQVIDAGHNPVTTGAAVGTIIYFQGKDKDASLTKTSESGRFLITGLPPGWIMLKTDSSDDSGNQRVRVFPGSVTLASIPVNHIPITVPVSGVLKHLRGGTGIASLSILGEQGQFSESVFGTPDGIPFPTNGSFIVKAARPGLIDSFNYQIKTGLLPQAGKKLFITSPAELQTLAAQGGLVLDSGRGIVAGRIFESLRKISPSTGAASIQPPQVIAVGFFDEDSLPDLAVATNSSTIEVFLGEKASPLTFKASRLTTVTGSLDPRSIAAGDFNRDGRTDLAIAYAGSGKLLILTSKGDGTFIEKLDISFALSAVAPEVLPPDVSPVFVRVADLDQDGNLDLTVANEVTGGLISDHVVTFLGDGTGGFSSKDSDCPLIINDGDSPVCLVKAMPRAIAAGDFDSDNQLDLAVASAGDSLITLILSGGLPTSNPSAGTTPASIAAMDLNRDGFLDLAVANAGSNSISSFLGDGNGGFTKVDCNAEPSDGNNDCLIGSEINPKQIVPADFDGDGRIDLAVLNEGSGTLVILPGIGDGRFGAPTAQELVGATPTAFAAADLDLNGLTDFAVINSGSNNITLLLSNLSPAVGISVEARDLDGNSVGSVRYQSDTVGTLDVNPSLAATDASGRFIIFNVPLGLTRIRGLRGGADPLIGSTILDLVQPNSLYFTDLNIARGAPKDVLLNGLSCRPVGIVCSRVGNVEVSFFGASKSGVCRSDPDCITSRVDGAFVGTLDPHSDYVVRLEGPDVLQPGDTDGDGVSDLQDNCPNIPNPDQTDTNGNRVGDACELQNADDDGDGIPNEIDNCRFTPNPGQRDDDQDGIGNLCDQTPLG